MADAEAGTRLTDAARELHELSSTLATHLDSATKEEARLRNEIRKRHEILKLTETGVDSAKLALAKTILSISDYSRGGADRASVISDAIKQLSTGRPIRQFYGDLWHVYFGTKNYDRWNGQRCDTEYGYGPSHGSICFSVRLTSETRARKQADLTAEEVEAAIYYLLNVERIQQAENAARIASAA